MWVVLLSNSEWAKVILKEVDKKASEALHHADLQFGHRHQLIQQLDEQHMVLFAELSPIQAHVPEEQI